MGKTAFKSITILDDNWVKEGTGSYFGYTYNLSIGLEWTFNDGNETFTETNGYGKAVLGKESVFINGDLLFTAGYSDGIAVRRVENNGSMSILYDELTPANGYAYYESLAVDTIRKCFYVGNNVYANLTKYDYSDTSSITKIGTLTEAGDGLPADQVGHTYRNGLFITGSWLHIGAADKTYTTVFRWNVETSASDNLTVSNVGSAGRYGVVWLEKNTNRLWLFSRDNGDTWLILNPEKSSSDPISASAFNINGNGVSLGNDMFMFGAATVNDNSNHVIIGGYYGRFGKVDISPILTQTSANPTVIDGKARIVSNFYTPTYILIEALSFIPHPTFGSDLVLIQPSMDHYHEYGWIDQENWMLVGPPRTYFYRWNWETGGTSIAYTWHSNDLLYFQYGQGPFLITTQDGSEYWILTGYGYDGSVIRTYSRTTFPDGFHLVETGSITFGDFYLPNSESIGSIKIGELISQLYILEDTKFNCFVSNNGGSSWENYDYTQEVYYKFNSSGNTGQIKFYFEGNKKRGPHITGKNKIVVSLKEKELSAMSPIGQEIKGTV
jgi:hypothetical protein